MKDQNISDELLHSFIDNELTESDKSRLFQILEQDDQLKARVCEMHNLKELLQHAYPDTSPPAIQTDKPLRRRFGLYSYCLAASLAFLVLGSAICWTFTTQNSVASYKKTASLIKTIQDNNIAADPSKIIVQVSNSNPVRIKMALDEAENLLKTYRENRQPLELEIIANGGGIDLLRAGRSPYSNRLATMQAKYENLHVYACNLSLTALQKTGIDVRLLPETLIATSALGEISKRVKEGWDYVRV
ncbi:MAG TPA: hypothetical protein VFN66_05455 [Burkholderiales bacterium]|nr:hypothetical protein [Burkholderiales bacterium]